jgi:hypothetical protein
MKRAKDIPKAPWSGAPDSVRCTRELDAELLTFGKMGGRSAIIHRTVRCASRATATSHATVDCNAFNAHLRAQRTEHAQKAHRTVYRTCPVHHQTAQRPHQSELQWSEPNDRLTSSPKSGITPNQIVTRESDTRVHLSSCAWIASFSHSFL